MFWNKINMTIMCSMVLSVCVGFAQFASADKYEKYTKAYKSGSAEHVDANQFESEEVHFAAQNWSPEKRQDYYTRPQGSHLMPFIWAVNLETADWQPGDNSETQFFFRSGNMEQYGYIAQKESTKINPYGLPVGFTKDGYMVNDGKNASLNYSKASQRDQLGMNCAACHSANLRYGDFTYRVDGGQAMANFQLFVNEWDRAVQAVLKNSAKFKRLLKNVQNSFPAETAESFLEKYKKFVEKRKGWRKRNVSPFLFGGGRTDAFGVIFNQVLSRDLKIPGNADEPNAPVSYPVIWDAPQHDVVQWNGLASNIKTAQGPLGRNFGQVLGVFGEVRIRKIGGLNKLAGGGMYAYCSSAKKQNLKDVESWITTLHSPQWPDQFGILDKGRVKRGRKLFVQNCQSCHADIQRDDPNRKIKARLFPVAMIGTDTKFNHNSIGRRVDGKYQPVQSGDLKGQLLGIFSGRPIEDYEAKGTLLKHIVSGAMLASVKGITCKEFESEGLFGSIKTSTLARLKSIYEVGRQKVMGFSDHHKDSLQTRVKGLVSEMMRLKTRPLNGIWASAPFLHNGSVKNLRELLLPANQRSKTFLVGCQNFDPRNVGYECNNVETKQKVSTYDTSLYGNTNTGHEFSNHMTDAERDDVLEYLKSL